ncbi:MAG: Gfo/Idh/MocA family oxidoreductase [Acidobacteriaceae bacterium]|nr:Gfo/Idh/MocA family oxidoreductase [Acidobacteriaceae bacterium]
MSQSKRTLRAAVIGYGLGGRVFHCPFLQAVPGLELAAIVQRHGDTAAAAWPEATIFRSVEEMLADPTIDLVAVTTPNESHFPLAKAALEAGKHVVVDKPMATTSAQIRELIELANARGLVLAPFQNRRFDGDFLTVQKLVRESTLGRIVQITSRFDRFRPEQRPGTWKETGGLTNGLLFDLGPHVVDQAVALFGTPQRLTASVREDRDQTNIDDAFTLTLEYDLPSGHTLRYLCEATLLSAQAQPRFVVQGTRGSYTKFGVDPQEPALIGGATVPSQDSSTQWLPDIESAWGLLSVATQTAEPVQLDTRKLPTETGDYRRFYASVRDAILGTAPLAIPAEDAFRSTRLLELAVESSRERRTLDVSL